MRNIRWILPFLMIIAIQAGCVLSEEKIRLRVPQWSLITTKANPFVLKSISTTDLKRGDIILYTYKDSSNYLKRLVGLPNETIEIQNGQVLINGEALDEPYEVAAPSYTMNKKTLGENEYFVLGDNRDLSANSHISGPVKWEQIIGRAVPVK